MDRRRRRGIAARAHEALDQALVLDALVYTDGNVEQAALLLGANATTVRRIRDSGALPSPLPPIDAHAWLTSPSGAPWAAGGRGTPVHRWGSRETTRSALMNDVAGELGRVAEDLERVVKAVREAEGLLASSK